MPTFSVPQEIIDCIVSSLQGRDSRTLKSCALVSRSFLHPSRKSLFSTIHLLSIVHSRYLHERVLSPTPEIARYIRELVVHGRLTDSEDDDRTERDDVDEDAVATWFETDQSFLRIIQLADCLQLLSLNEFGPPISWDLAFSKESQSALLDRFQSPHLNVLKIFRCQGLPVSILASLSQLKGLSIPLGNFGSQALPTHSTPLAQLNAIELCQQNSQVSRTILPPMPKLYLLSFPRYYDEYVVQHVFRSARSIKSLILNLVDNYMREHQLLMVIAYETNPKPCPLALSVPLELIEDLQSIFIYCSITGVSWVGYPLAECSRVLRSPAATHSLKELTLAFKYEPLSESPRRGKNQMERDLASLLLKFSEWGLLDTSLSAISTLRKVHISIPCTGDLLADGILRIETRAHLPQLHGRRILSIKTGEDVDQMKNAVWSRAVYQTDV